MVKMKIKSISRLGTPLLVLLAIVATYLLMTIFSAGDQALSIGVISVVIGNMALSLKLSSEIGNIRAEMGNMRADFYKALSEQSKEFSKGLSDNSKESGKEHSEIRRDIHNLDKRASGIEHALKIN